MLVLTGKRDAITQQGAALPLCLILASLIALATIQILRATHTEALLAGTIGNAYQNFSRAETGIGETLRLIEVNAIALPMADQGVQVPELTSGAFTTILNTGRDTQCPEFSIGLREHYEIHSRLNNDDHANYVHVQGVFICTEQCPEAPCIGAISAPQLSYWTTIPISAT